MSAFGDESHKELQREVQRLLGRCLLRVQQYERQIKAILAHHKHVASVRGEEVVQLDQVQDGMPKTLGVLVRDLLGSYVIPESDKPALEDDCLKPGDRASFSFCANVVLSDAEFERTKEELKAFVELRNMLVHRFSDDHDLSTTKGCCIARDALVVHEQRILDCTDQLLTWAEDLVNLGRRTAEILRSKDFEELIVNRIAPDGTVRWPSAGIVACLRQAARELETDGWIPVKTAAAWIGARYPDQFPAKYGCKSWPQVLHEARVFEIRYLQLEGQRAAHYRLKDTPSGPT